MLQYERLPRPHGGHVGEELLCQHKNSNRADPFAAMRVIGFAFRCLSLVL